MKILVLSSVYKDMSLGNKDKSTNIVNSFVKEWKKQGHDVLVIHNSHCYPKLVHNLPEKVKKLISTKIGFELSSFEVVKEKKYLDNGVKIFRLPIKKYKPHSKPSDFVIRNQVNKIVKILNDENFKPDVITGHWASPQMEIIYELKKIYHCRTAIVLHGCGYIESKEFNVEKYLENIDSIGTRSLFQAKQVKEIIHLEKMPFVCYSGIPNEYLLEYKLNTDKYKDFETWRIAYVGRLVSYKKIDAIIEALSRVQNINWEFNIVGEGGTRKELEELARKLGCKDKVHFLGRVSRDEVMRILKNTHIFVMISISEVFGLVYLESMASSCLTIASKKGGVDGIIINEQNGFLCNEGDCVELTSILENIFSCDAKTLMQIAEQGYKTALKYSDYKVAKKYLNYICGSGKND